MNKAKIKNAIQFAEYLKKQWPMAYYNLRIGKNKVTFTEHDLTHALNMKKCTLIVSGIMEEGAVKNIGNGFMN